MLDPMAQQYSMQHSWGWLVVRGILAIIFGIIAIASPGIALLALILVFGAYALIDGILAVGAAIRERDRLPRWGWLLAEGIAGIILGIIAFIWPGETALILLFIIAAWAIITGCMEMGAAFLGRSWIMGLAGALSIILGLLFLARPGAGILSILWVLGFYAILFGILLIVHGFHQRTAQAAGWHDRVGGGMQV